MAVRSHWVAVVLASVTGVAAGCGLLSDDEETVGGPDVETLASAATGREQEDDEGTRLVANPTGGIRCLEGTNGALEVSGGVVTTGSVDSVELTAGVDGAAPVTVGTIPPQAFEHEGREKRAHFAAQVPVSSGQHAIEVCLTQSGAQGRTPKRTCAPVFVLTVTCPEEPTGSDPGADLIPPTSAAQGIPDANVHGWNDGDVSVRISAFDSPANGSGVAEISIALSGAERGAWVVSGEVAVVPVTKEGETVITWFATDRAGNIEASKELVVRIDKTAPTVTFAPPAPAANEWGWNNEQVSLAFEVTDALSGVERSTPSSPLVFAREGESLAETVIATDLAGNRTEAVSPLVNLDWTPPTLGGLPSRDCVLWSPNHKLVTVASITAGDALAGMTRRGLVVTGWSSEVADGKGDGDTEQDIVIEGGEVKLRAERSGLGDDRVYTVKAVATDAAANVTRAQFTCTVPHDRKR